MLPQCEFLFGFFKMKSQIFILIVVNLSVLDIRKIVLNFITFYILQRLEYNLKK